MDGYRREIQPTFGHPDGWEIGGAIRFTNDGFSTFRIETGNKLVDAEGLVMSLALELKTTGRIRCRPGYGYGVEWQRMQFRFVGDGEPDVICYGWVTGPIKEHFDN